MILLADMPESGWRAMSQSIERGDERVRVLGGQRRARRRSARPLTASSAARSTKSGAKP